jgi:hypothetical protein
VAGCRLFSSRGQKAIVGAKAEVRTWIPKFQRLNALQLARSGQAASIDDIKKQVKLERYDHNVVDGGPLLTGQLKMLIREARERKGDQKVAPTRL